MSGSSRHAHTVTTVIFLVAVFSFLPYVTPIRAEEEAVVDVGFRLQLFMDDYLIHSRQNVTLKMHRAGLAETVMQFDAPWEGSSTAYITVFQDGSIYRMYYRAVAGNPSASGADWIMNTCYAESDNGIHWRRPDLGLFGFDGSNQNNIIWAGGAPGIFDTPVNNFSPFLDTNPNSLPSERYKALSGTFGFAHEGYKKGYESFVSADGIHWRKATNGYVIGREHWPEHSDASSIPVFWSSAEESYIAYLRIRVDEKGQPISSRDPNSVRWVGLTTSRDFIHWADVVPLVYGDTRIEPFYTSAITPYFRATEIYCGFPMRFLPDRDAKLPSVYDRGRGRGMSDVVFMNSRDGLHWDRRFMESFVRPGLDPRNWTDRCNMVATGLVPTGPGEMSFYISEHHRLPTNRLRRRVLRTDGIVSVNAPLSGGELVTKPLTFQGERLVLNYSTSAAGGIRVEMLDVNLMPISGYAATDAVEIFGDSIEHEVMWQSGVDVNVLAGKTIRLRFLMKDADLYSFRFKE